MIDTLRRMFIPALQMRQLRFGRGGELPRVTRLCWGRTLIHSQQCAGFRPQLRPGIKGSPAGSLSRPDFPEPGHALTSARPHSRPAAPGRGHRFPPSGVGITNRKLGHRDGSGQGFGRRGWQSRPGVSPQPGAYLVQGAPREGLS